MANESEVAPWICINYPILDLVSKDGDSKDLPAFFSTVNEILIYEMDNYGSHYKENMYAPHLCT